MLLIISHEYIPGNQLGVHFGITGNDVQVSKTCLFEALCFGCRLDFIHFLMLLASICCPLGPNELGGICAKYRGISAPATIIHTCHQQAIWMAVFFSTVCNNYEIHVHVYTLMFNYLNFGIKKYYDFFLCSKVHGL